MRGERTFITSSALPTDFMEQGVCVCVCVCVYV
jgi:hypothetical protein